MEEEEGLEKGGGERDRGKVEGGGFERKIMREKYCKATKPYVINGSSICLGIFNQKRLNIKYSINIKLIFLTGLVAIAPLGMGNSLLEYLDLSYQ